MPASRSRTPRGGGAASASAVPQGVEGDVLAAVLDPEHAAEVRGLGVVLRQAPGDESAQEHIYRCRTLLVGSAGRLAVSAAADEWAYLSSPAASMV